MNKTDVRFERPFLHAHIKQLFFTNIPECSGFFAEKRFDSFI